MRSGKQIVRVGIVALMFSCLSIAGCNRHEAHDDDDDDSDSAPVAAGSAAAPHAPAPDASTATTASGTDSAAGSSMSQTAATPPADQGTSAPPAETSSSASSEQPAPAASEPASEPAPAETAPAPAKHHRAAKAVASTEASSEPKPSSTPTKHSAAAPVAWWTASASSPLSVLAVGPAAGMSGIVVLASKDLGDAAAAGKHIKVVRDGKTVSGSWHAGANGRVLVLDSLKPGRYEMTIDGELASSDGQKLGNKLHGPVFVR